MYKRQPQSGRRCRFTGDDGGHGLGGAGIEGTAENPGGNGPHRHTDSVSPLDQRRLVADLDIHRFDLQARSEPFAVKGLGHNGGALHHEGPLLGAGLALGDQLPEAFDPGIAGAERLGAAALTVSVLS